MSMMIKRMMMVVMRMRSMMTMRLMSMVMTVIWSDAEWGADVWSRWSEGELRLRKILCRCAFTQHLESGWYFEQSNPICINIYLSRWVYSIHHTWWLWEWWVWWLWGWCMKWMKQRWAPSQKESVNVLCWCAFTQHLQSKEMFLCRCAIVHLNST